MMVLCFPKCSFWLFAYSRPRPVTPPLEQAEGLVSIIMNRSSYSYQVQSAVKLPNYGYGEPAISVPWGDGFTLG